MAMDASELSSAGVGSWVMGEVQSGGGVMEMEMGWLGESKAAGGTGRGGLTEVASTTGGGSEEGGGLTGGEAMTMGGGSDVMGGGMGDSVRGKTEGGGRELMGGGIAAVKGR